MEEGQTTSWYDTFLDSSVSGAQSTIDLILLLIGLDLAGPTDLEHSDTTTQLGEVPLELVLLVLRGGAIDGDADLFSTNTNTVQHQGGDGIAVDIFTSSGMIT